MHNSLSNEECVVLYEVAHLLGLHACDCKSQPFYVAQLQKGEYSDDRDGPTVGVQ